MLTARGDEYDKVRGLEVGFRHADGPMCAGGSFAGSRDPLDRLGVFFGIQLLVLFRETARVRAPVTRASLRLLRRQVSHTIVGVSRAGGRIIFSPASP